MGSPLRVSWRHSRHSQGASTKFSRKVANYDEPDDGPLIWIGVTKPAETSRGGFAQGAERGVAAMLGSPAPWGPAGRAD